MEILWTEKHDRVLAQMVERDWAEALAEDFEREFKSVIEVINYENPLSKG